MLSTFYDKIKELKTKSNYDVLEFQFQDYFLSFRTFDNSKDTISLLTNWRKKYWNGFDTKFNVTEKSTTEWINKKIFNSSDRLLLLLICNSKKIGHVGLSMYNSENNSLYFSDIMRGERGFAQGLMENVINTFTNWIFTSLKISKISLRVFSDQFKAIQLYEKCGFLTTNSIPQKRIVTNDGWKWIKTELDSPDEFAERYINIMGKISSISKI